MGERAVFGFAAMGKPISYDRRQKAYDSARKMGCTGEEAYLVIDGMSDLLQRDKPYEAMNLGTKYVDITGVYRLLAELLT